MRLAGRHLALASTVAAALLAGCGGGEETTAPRSLAGPQGASGPSEALEPAQLEQLALDRFDEVCRSADRALRFAEKQELGTADARKEDPPTRAELQRFYDEVVLPARRDEYELLSRFVVPPARAEALDAYLEEFHSATRALGEDLALIRHPGIETDAYRRTAQLAAAAGLERCGAG